MAYLLYDDFCDDERFGGYDNTDSCLMNRSNKKIKKNIPAPIVAVALIPLLTKKSSKVKIVIPIAEKTPIVLPKIVEKKLEEPVKDSWEDDD